MKWMHLDTSIREHKYTHTHTLQMVESDQSSLLQLAPIHLLWIEPDPTFLPTLLPSIILLSRLLVTLFYLVFPENFLFFTYKYYQKCSGLQDISTIV